MKISYEEYKQDLIEAGEALMMELPQNWKRELFSRKFNQQLRNDTSIPSNKILPILLLANSYLDMGLFVGMSKHPNIDNTTVDSMINIGFNGESHRLEFIKSIIRNRPDLITVKVANSAWNNFYDESVVRVVLQSPEVCSFLQSSKITNFLNDMKHDEERVQEVKGFDHLEANYMKVYEMYDSDVYLSDDLKATFIF